MAEGLKETPDVDPMATGTNEVPPTVIDARDQFAQLAGEITAEENPGEDDKSPEMQAA